MEVASRTEVTIAYDLTAVVGNILFQAIQLIAVVTF